MAQLQGKIRLQTTFSAFCGSWYFGKLDGDYGLRYRSGRC